MLSRRFMDSVLDSSVWLVGGALLTIIAWSAYVLAPTAIGRWF